jgi:hypothetical protein
LIFCAINERKINHLKDKCRLIQVLLINNMNCMRLCMAFINMKISKDVIYMGFKQQYEFHTQLYIHKCYGMLSNLFVTHHWNPTHWNNSTTLRCASSNLMNFSYWNYKKHLILTFFFQLSFWLYIVIKKKGWNPHYPYHQRLPPPPPKDSELLLMTMINDFSFWFWELIE